MFFHQLTKWICTHFKNSGSVCFFFLTQSAKLQMCIKRLVAAHSNLLALVRPTKCDLHNAYSIRTAMGQNQLLSWLGSLTLPLHQSH